jgi:hypothetical protein
VYPRYWPMRTKSLGHASRGTSCVRYYLRISTSATEVGEGGGNQNLSDENSPDEIRPVVFPLHLPAPFREDIGDAAVLEVALMVFQATLIYGLSLGAFAAIEQGYSSDPSPYIASQQITASRA